MPTGPEPVIDAHRGGWKNGRSETNWRRPLTYAVSLGRVPVDQITTSDLARVLRPVWHDKPETARNLRTRLGMVMRWAIAEGHRTDDPAGPALTAALPKHTAPPKHHRSLPHGEIAEALRIVDGSARAWPVSKACLRFIVATACRSGEARLARWDEIDRDAETWTIPGERTKTQRPHVVPLSKMALAALAEAHRHADGSGHVFPAPTGRGRALSDSGLSKLLRENDIPGTVHGMRASFRSWAAEQGIPREVAEAQLGHVAGKIERAYRPRDTQHRPDPTSVSTSRSLRRGEPDSARSSCSSRLRRTPQISRRMKPIQAGINTSAATRANGVTAYMTLSAGATPSV